MAIVFLDRRNVAVACAGGAIIFALGVIIGYFGNDTADSGIEAMVSKLVGDQFANEQDLVRKALDGVSTDKLREYHKTLTAEPHIAGHRRDNELIAWIQKEWKEMELDKVEAAEYDFYLSWPNQTWPNEINLLDGSGNVQFTSQFKEQPLRDGDDHPDFIHAFNAFTPAATVEGDLVYVHYGRVEDLRKLQDLGVSLEGKIAISRYGKIFRGNKLKNCQTKGAIGLILFSDPGDVAVQGVEPENVYPNTIFLPGSGVQRGSTFIGSSGDPLSPGWPSVPNAYRVDPEDVEGLPKIPAQPIGYDDARELLSFMGGDVVPEEWQGKIPSVNYRLGGAMMPPDWKVRLSTHNYRGTVKSSNVIGYIRGEAEPDRYVMLSNHRDAWGFGAVDPSSGTAQLMEVVRSFGQLKKNGWRPKRTLVFASWASEEAGLQGSYEWVYHHINKVMQRTVGLVNTDICVSGPIISPAASPVLKDILVDSLKEASDPTTDTGRSYYDFWDEWTNQDNNGTRKQPEFKLLGSGTDHAPFAFYAGVPAINIAFEDDKKKYKGVGTYPTYHTGYETFYLVDKLIDPGYKIHRTCAQTSMHVLLHLLDSAVLPYNLRNFPKIMHETLQGFDKTNVTKQLEAGGATLKHVKRAVQAFKTAADSFMDNLDKIKASHNPITLRIANDQLMQLERVFVMPAGLPNRPGVRNAIFAPGLFNRYAGSAFPAISDLLHEIEQLDSQASATRWKQIKQHVSDLMIMIQNAARFLRPPHEI